MIKVKIMHVADGTDTSEVVRLSLAGDPELTVHCCASGAEALAEIEDWQPDLVLLDVQAPAMDGPMTLDMLQRNPATATIPVVLMTGRANEVAHYRTLGAAGVVEEPLDPGRLAQALRRFLPRKLQGLGVIRDKFLDRARMDAITLKEMRTTARAGLRNTEIGPRARQVAHSLAGAAGMLGFQRISADAIALEEVLRAEGSPPDVCDAIDALVASISSADQGSGDIPRSDAAAEPERFIGGNGAATTPRP